MNIGFYFFAIIIICLSFCTKNDSSISTKSKDVTDFNSGEKLSTGAITEASKRNELEILLEDKDSNLIFVKYQSAEHFIQDTYTNGDYLPEKEFYYFVELVKSKNYSMIKSLIPSKFNPNLFVELYMDYLESQLPNFRCYPFSTLAYFILEASCSPELFEYFLDLEINYIIVAFSPANRVIYHHQILIPLYADHIELVDRFIRKISNTPAEAFSGDTFVDVLGAQNIGLIKYFIDLGVDVNMYGDNSSPLGYAVSIENKEIIDLLLSHGANPNLSYYSCCTGPIYNPLVIACKSNNLELVKYLVQNGANPNITLNLYMGLRMKFSDEIMEYLIDLIKN